MFPSASVQREQAISVEIRSLSVRSVEIIRRRTEREEGDAIFRVDCEIAPCVDSADVFPGVLRERVIMRLSGVGHSVELPHKFSGYDIVGPQISGRRNIFFARGRTENHQVLEDLAGATRLYAAH